MGPWVCFDDLGSTCNSSHARSKIYPPKTKIAVFAAKTACLRSHIAVFAATAPVFATKPSVFVA